jgi:hypothetical protein
MVYPRLQRHHLPLVVLVLLFASGSAAASTASAQPNPGIDPCSRALASRGTPAAVATPDQVANRLARSQVVMTFASCFNRHNWIGVVALTEAAFRESFIGATTEADTRARLEALDARGLLPQIRIQSIEENGASGPQLAVLAVTWQGWNGLHRELWRLQSTDAGWILTGRSIDRPVVSGVAVGIQLTITEDRLVAPRSDLVNPGSVILAFTDQRADQVSALVLAVPPGATAVDIVDTCNDPESQLEPVGSIPVDPGSVVYLPMLELPAGRYAVVTGADPCMSSASIETAQVVLLDITQ